ncbi:MAG: hypothetical protein H7259_09635 [Cytophagales bacterium]|nr:hypothetical protein [Cytophaga sp.]
MKTNPKQQQPTPVQPADISSGKITPSKKEIHPSKPEPNKSVKADSNLVHGNTLDQHIIDQPADQEEG